MSEEAQFLNGRYAIGALLGQGGFGQTWAARDVETGAEVVVKQVIIREVAGWKPVELFEREVAVLRTVHHPGVPRFLDAFRTDGGGRGVLMALVMERIPGDSLLTLIQRGHRWSEPDARALLTSLLEILQHLQSLSPPVIHRDIKPSNVIVKPDGQPALIDFGAVHDLAARMGHDSLTAVGTAGYMAPEQAMGGTVLASDLFALGATMLHALTHCHPADLPRRGLRLVFEDRVGCSPDLIQILGQMVEPDVSRRYQRASDVLADLRRPRGALAPFWRRPETTISVERAPIELDLPQSPRTPSKAALETISSRAGDAAIKALCMDLSITGFALAVGVGAGWPAPVLGVLGAAALVSGVFSAKSGRRWGEFRWREIYRTGVAVQATAHFAGRDVVDGRETVTVRYSFEVDGVRHRDDLHVHGPSASRIDERCAVLVVYDPKRPKRHIATVVVPG